MKKNPTGISGSATLVILAASSWTLITASIPSHASMLNFGLEQSLGRSNKNPAAPFLRFGPDGRLSAIWTEADDRSALQANPAHQHESTMRRAPCRLRVAGVSAPG